MQTANLSIVVLTEGNFTKQTTLEIRRWMESRKNLIEHSHFKKKSFLKNQKSSFLCELEAPKVVVIVHNPENSAMSC